MRALIVVDQLRRPVPGGIGTYARGLVQGLSSLGPDAVHATSWGGPALPAPLVTRAWDRGLLAPPAGFDVVHATSLAVPPRRGAPMTVFVHDLAWRLVPDAYPARGRRWHEAALQRALARTSAFLVPSQATADALVAAGAVATQVHVAPEGCDHLPSPDRDGARTLLARLGVREGYVLSVSTLEPRKNLARLVAAHELARERMPERWPLVVVGPTGWGEALVPGSGAVLAGRVDDAVLAALYAGARAVAYVPLVEGFGLPAVEAMACGAPVVASSMPSTAGAALEVDPLDAESIAEGLVAATTDGDRRARLLEAGCRRADELTWHAAARAHVEVWAALT